MSTGNLAPHALHKRSMDPSFEITRSVSGFLHEGHRTNFSMNPSKLDCSFSWSCAPVITYRFVFSSQVDCTPKSEPKSKLFPVAYISWDMSVVYREPWQSDSCLG